MDPAGPSLEEASCGAGLVGRLCQKGFDAANRFLGGREGVAQL